MHTNQQKTFQGTLGTRDLNSIGSKTILGHIMDPAGLRKGTSKFSKILEPKSGCVYHFYIIDSVAPLTMLDYFFGDLGTLSRLRGPYGTFMDTPNGPQNGPCEANFRGPFVKKGLIGSLHDPK